MRSILRPITSTAETDAPPRVIYNDKRAYFVAERLNVRRLLENHARGYNRPNVCCISLKDGNYFRAILFFFDGSVGWWKMAGIRYSQRNAEFLRAILNYKLLKLKYLVKYASIE
jgi:hypothetical protein